MKTLTDFEQAVIKDIETIQRKVENGDRFICNLAGSSILRDEDYRLSCQISELIRAMVVARIGAKHVVESYLAKVVHGTDDEIFVSTEEAKNYRLVMLDDMRKEVEGVNG